MTETLTIQATDLEVGDILRIGVSFGERVTGIAIVPVNGYTDWANDPSNQRVEFVTEDDDPGDMPRWVFGTDEVEVIRGA